MDSAWLERQGIGRRSAYAYVKRGWLERVARGVFRRPSPSASFANTLDWKTCLLSMQHIMDYKLHVGGMSALGLRGHSHYLRLGSEGNVWVYGNDIPNWLAKLPLNAALETRSLSLFTDTSLGLNSQEDQRSLASASLPWDWTLTMSTPERAILEALDELPDHESFHAIDMAFESLANLRPRRVSELLKTARRSRSRVCSSSLPTVTIMPGASDSTLRNSTSGVVTARWSRAERYTRATASWYRKNS